MKSPTLIAVAVLTLMTAPGLAVAQTAAATLPDAFGAPTAPAPGPRLAAASDPAALAPDIRRSEDALRSLILAFQSGQIDYAVFSDSMAPQIRAQAPEVAPLVQHYGALRSIEYRGRHNGTDLFRVVFEKQTTDWVIAFNNDDLIDAMLFRPAQDQ